MNSNNLLRRMRSASSRSPIRSSCSSCTHTRHDRTVNSSVRSFSSAIKPSPLLTTPLSQQDPAIHAIIEHEKRRQRDSLTLIPSENYTSVAVLSALGSIMQNKYSEGYPGARYYGGNEFIDQAESLCQQRALEAYHLSPQEWGVNVQAHSGSPANFYVYTAVLEPHGRLMSLDLPHGGHLSHGYQTPTRKVSAVSIYFEVLPYRLDEKTGIIDYAAMEHSATLFRPKLIVAGASAYPRLIDYERMRKIADMNGSLLLADMAHISGLVAAGVMPTPFKHADIVTTTTHKSLRGPRGAMIFYRKGVRTPASGTKPAVMYDLDEKINAAVFPGHQGGPHNHTITALAVALQQAASPDFKAYQQAVLENSSRLSQKLIDLGYTLVSGGTDNHLCLIDLRSKKINGAKVEKMLECVNIAANKNTVPGDLSAMNPGGLRIGTPAITTRGLTLQHMDQVATFIHRAVQLSIETQKSSGTKLVDFKRFVDERLADPHSEIAQLRNEVTQFARGFPCIGFDEHSMKFS